MALPLQLLMHPAARRFSIGDKSIDDLVLVLEALTFSEASQIVAGDAGETPSDVGFASPLATSFPNRLIETASSNRCGALLVGRVVIDDLDSSGVAEGLVEPGLSLLDGRHCYSYCAFSCMILLLT